MTALICTFLGYMIASGATVDIWLAAFMDLLQFGYRCISGATSGNIPEKLTLASFLLVWYCVSAGTWICGAIGSTVIIDRV